MTTTPPASDPPPAGDPPPDPPPAGDPPADDDPEWARLRSVVREEVSGVLGGHVGEHHAPPPPVDENTAPGDKPPRSQGSGPLARLLYGSGAK